MLASSNLTAPPFIGTTSAGQKQIKKLQKIMDILTFINSLTNEDLNRIRNSKSDAEARRLLRENYTLQLQQTDVMVRLFGIYTQDGLVELFWNEKNAEDKIPVYKKDHPYLVFWVEEVQLPGVIAR